MTPEEIRTMPRNRCLLMISGVVPFYSYKFDLKKHQMCIRDRSYSVAGPQLLQFNSNYVLSDPKGELLDTYGNVLVSQGYDAVSYTHLSEGDTVW